jgi:hypothetical protein
MPEITEVRTERTSRPGNEYSPICIVEMTSPMSDGPTDDTRSGREPDPITGPPPWVKRVLIVSAVLLVLLVVMLVSGEHGPGRHLKAGAAGTLSAVDLVQVTGLR